MAGSGIRFAPNAPVGLGGRWHPGRLIERAFGANGLGDWTVSAWGLYTDRVSQGVFAPAIQKIRRAGGSHWSEVENIW